MTILARKRCEALDIGSEKTPTGREVTVSHRMWTMDANKVSQQCETLTAKEKINSRSQSKNLNVGQVAMANWPRDQHQEIHRSSSYPYRTSDERDQLFEFRDG
jgi:hypothetical protein